MDSETFAEIIENQIRVSRDVLVDKGRQYADGDDKLHNFRVAAALQDITMMEALGGMMAKHTVSVYDMINSTNLYTLDQWNEKITDHINYLLLLAAVIRDEEEREYIRDEFDGSINCPDPGPKVTTFLIDEAPWADLAKSLHNLFDLSTPVSLDSKRRKM